MGSAVLVVSSKDFVLLRVSTAGRRGDNSGLGLGSNRSSRGSGGLRSRRRGVGLGLLNNNRLGFRLGLRLFFRLHLGFLGGRRWRWRRRSLGGGRLSRSRRWGSGSDLRSRSRTRTAIGIEDGEVDILGMSKAIFKLAFQNIFSKTITRIYLRSSSNPSMDPDILPALGDRGRQCHNAAGKG